MRSFSNTRPETYAGRLAVQQRVLPGYRVPFFDLLAESCAGGMSLFAGKARAEEMIASGKTQVAKYVQAENIHLFHRGLYLCYQQGFINWLENWNPDSLIVEANPRYLATPFAARWMRARGKKIIGWGLGAPRVGARSVKRQFWFSFVNQFDALISYSQRGADEYAALGFPRERIFVAHNSVSPKPASPIAQRPPTFDLRPTLLFVGRLQSRKRIDSLLKACAALESRVRLIIVGDGPDRARLESIAKEIYPSAEFIGAKHGEELKPYFLQADLFVLPGTGGLAVQEAMSYGLPVIVAKGDGTQDDLVREENGWQIEPENYDALLSALKNALTDIARLRSMGAESYRIISEEINIQKMAEKFVQALNAVQ
ncbi:MAG: glycosyltransferase family 4 protein [Anaerolineales bacterium]|nr:glycosyltransferase family 4 protein [Anaerolineales bacterium]